MNKKKIFLTISLAWIILVGYLVWINGIMNEGNNKFKWDEWIWFGLIPAIVPYFFYFIWKPDHFKKFINSDNN